MHSSTMRTVRLLPVSPGMHCSRGGVPGPGGVPGLGGTWSEGVYLVPGGVPGLGGVPAQVPQPVDRITDACEYITLPQLRCGR